jgi:MoxR-like ATPase
MFQVILDYPLFADEVNILKQTTGSGAQRAGAVLNAEQIRNYQSLVREVPVTDNVFEQVVKMVQQTRPNTESAHTMATQYLSYGAGPRAGQNLILAAKCHALMHGKYTVDREDVIAVSKWVLRHRIVRNFRAEAEGVSADQIIEAICK